MSSGELIGALAQKQGPVVYEESKDLLLSLIQNGLENESSAEIEGDTAQEVFIYFPFNLISPILS